MYYAEINILDTNLENKCCKSTVHCYFMIPTALININKWTSVLLSV